MKILVLAGGKGTRLFPLSRENFPKQFLKIKDNKSLFTQTIERILSIVKPEDLIISTNEKYKFLIEEELKKISPEVAKKSSIIFEPVNKNTAPAIALGIKFLQENLKCSEDEVLFVCPADHVIFPEEKFTKYIILSEEIAQKGYIITYGIVPTRPETGYGYIEAGEKIKTKSEIEAFKVLKFHEKPPLETAQNYLEKGNFYWNSGMFAFSLKTILKEFQILIPEIYEFLNNYKYKDLLANFHQIPDISIDYAIMEKTKKAVVIPMDIYWSDVGSWEAIYEILEKDEKGLIKKGKVIDIEAKKSLIWSEKRTICVLDVENLIIVETDDILLIMKKGAGQRVKDLVNKLKNNDLKEATESHLTTYRPWGSFTELERGERYKIKKIIVKPGEELSLQRHYHRSEHWIVVKGTAKVILENDNGEIQEFFVCENESIFVPKTKKHRLINPGKIPLELIEVQVGEYVEEDDIERFKDKYGRNTV